MHFLQLFLELSLENVKHYLIDVWLNDTIKTSAKERIKKSVKCLSLMMLYLDIYFRHLLFLNVALRIGHLSNHLIKLHILRI